MFIDRKYEKLMTQIKEARSKLNGIILTFLYRKVIKIVFY
jgi:hypothetical protein